MIITATSSKGEVMSEGKKPEHADGVNVVNVVNVVDVAYIEKKIYSVVADQLEYDRTKLSRATRFIGDLLSGPAGDHDNYEKTISKYELMMEIEGELDMSIPDDEIEKMDTLGKAIDYFAGVLIPRDEESELLRQRIAARKKKQKS
jgi:acyl carrier protein